MLFWRISPFVAPVITRQRAISSAELFISFLEKNIALGLPVVPLDVCSLITFSGETVKSP